MPRELVNAEWAAPGLAADLEAVREELGLPDGCRLTAELHAMLVYERGQFFVAAPGLREGRRDGRDARRDVAVGARGGELVVHHLGEATTYRGMRDRISLWRSTPTAGTRCAG